MDLSKLINRFLKPVTWIFQSCSVYFSPFDKQNQADAWPRFHSLLKLLLWNNGESKYWMNAFGFVVPLAMFALKDALCTLCNIKKRFKTLRDLFFLWNTDITKHCWSMKSIIKIKHCSDPKISNEAEEHHRWQDYSLCVKTRWSRMNVALLIKQSPLVYSTGLFRS